ncbi:MAG: glycosyltransferase [Candidatus Omnitrophica bacterium]|nr:glycosyltransferase [Candidatus Omnitrophota bacterium]
MNKTKISVYIPSHNYGRYLQEAIESVLRQTVDNWELILIDVNSSDNTKDIMDLYKGDKRIRVFHSKDTRLAQVANFALKQSRGEYIMRLDADDVLDENILLVMGNYLDLFPDVALVSPGYFLVDEYGEIIRYEGKQSIHHSAHSLDAPPNGACTMIRRSALRKLGGYREDLDAQDGFDLWMRILREYKCAGINLPLFYYRRHGKNLTQDHVRILSARRIIKKDACAVNLDKFRPIIAVIPCRRNYDIYPDLWNKKLNGKTLLGIAMETCLSSDIFDKIVVTSDNKVVHREISRYGDRRLCFVERSKESTISSRSISYTLERIVKSLKIGYTGISILSYIQTPFTSRATLEEAIYTLVLNNTDSVFGVREVEDDLYMRAIHGLTPIGPKEKMKSEFDVVYARTFTATAIKNNNLETGNLSGGKISYFIVPREEAFFIRAKRDYEIAGMLARRSLRQV